MLARHGGHAALPAPSGRTGAASPGPGPPARVVQKGALPGAGRLAGGVQGDHPLQPGVGGQGWGHEADPGNGLVQDQDEAISSAAVTGPTRF